MAGGRSAASHSPVQGRAFLQRTQSFPECCFYRMPLFRTQVFGSKGVTDAAAKTKKSVLFNLPKHSAAVRASERGRLTQTFLAGNLVHVEFCNSRFFNRFEKCVAGLLHGA